MDNKQYQEAVKKAIQPKFRGRKQLESKYVPLYPDNAERDMRRLTNAYMKILKSEIKDQLPAIMAAYKRERHDDSRYDDLFDLGQELNRIFQTIAEKVEKKFSTFNLKEKLLEIAKGTQRTSYREWKRSVQKTVGMDLIDNYYSTDFYSSIIQPWVDQSVSMIQSIPQQELGEMKAIISEGFRDNLPIDEIAQRIQEEYNVSKSKAQFLARDQIGSLNTQLTRRQHEDAGVKKYRWTDSGDGKVRDCHHLLNGHIFSWDDPPEMWTTRKGARVYTGRRCHPGEDYGCRCRAEPVFEYDTIDLPVKHGDQKKK